MTSQQVSATRWKCDNPSCGIVRLSDDRAVPVGWFAVGWNGLAVVSSYCSRDCVDAGVRSTSVMQRDTGGGWLASSLIESRPA